MSGGQSSPASGVARSALSSDVIARLPKRASFIVGADGQPRDAIIPYADYKQIIAEDMARKGEAIPDDPNTDWMEFEEMLAEFSAPRIASLRKRRGLTQAQLGAKLKMPQSQVSRLEKHPGSVTYRTLQRLAKALGVATADLFTSSDRRQ